MGTSSEAADLVVKIGIEEMNFCIQIFGKAAKEIAIALYVMSKDKQKTKGKTRLSNMLKSEKEIKIFSVKNEDMKVFAKEAKKYGVLYCALRNRYDKSKDGLIDIMVRAQDAPKINRIVERFNLTTVDKALIKSEFENEKTKISENMEKAIDPEDIVKDLGVETMDIDDQMIDDIFSKPVKKEEQHVPLEIQTEKNSLSENSSMSKSKLEGTTKNPEKKSVRKELKEIAENQEAKEKLKENEKIKDNLQPTKYTSDKSVKEKVEKRRERKI